MFKAFWGSDCGIFQRVNGEFIDGTLTPPHGENVQAEVSEVN